MAGSGVIAAAARREVPAHDTRELGPRRGDHAVVIPVIDEGERLHRLLARLRPFAEDSRVDVVIADGGSTDGSLEPEGLRAAGVRACLVKSGPGRLSAQLRMGLAWGLDQGYEGLLTLDGNDKDDPSAVPLFVEKLRAGFDHVQGSRFVPGGHAVNTPWTRWLGLRLVHAPLLSAAAGFRYTDTTNGFRGYSRRLLLDERIAPFRDLFVGYELPYYLAVQAARRGYRVCEIPVTRAYPRSGPTPTRISFFRGNAAVLGALVRTCLGRFDPPGAG